MPNTLQTTLNFCLPFFQYSPLIAGYGGEPACTIASIVRNSMLSPPFSWPWNRNEDSSTSVVQGTQDYTVNLTNFGWLEKASITDSNGNIWELKDVYNASPLSKSTPQQRPSAISIISYSPGVSIKVRLLGIPDQSYTLNLTYQGIPIQFQAATVTAAANAVAGNTTYTGTFNTAVLTSGVPVYILGFQGSNPDPNNGTFTVVSCTATSLVVANPNGVAESTTTASAINSAWAPIPDWFSDVFNILFLGEAFQSVGDIQEAMRYRQRGVAALLSKAEGLTETQKSAYIQQWLARDAETQSLTLRVTQGNQARGV